MLRIDDAGEIAAAYGLGPDAAMAGPVARGELGQVWRLRAGDRSFAVKEPFAPLPLHDTRQAAGVEVEALGFGLPVPALQRTVEGDVVLAIAGGLIRLYEWVDMLDLDRHLDPALVGEAVAALHRAPFSDGPGLDPWFRTPVGAATWDELVAALRDGGAPMAEPLAAMRHELVAVESLLRDPRSVQVCHRDLFADNVRARPDGGLCIFDWDNCGLADPAQELAMVLFEYGCGESDRYRALYDAYLDAGGPARVTDAGDFSMPIAFFGHIVELHSRRWLDPAHASDRARLAANVAEATSDPLTRDVIAQVLDSISR